MTTAATPASSPAVGASAAKERFLDVYEKEHARTMRVLRAFPAEQSELRPHAMCKTARELAYIFTLERGLGTMVMNNAFADGVPAGKMPEPPATWEDVLAANERSHRDFVALIRDMPEPTLDETVKFMVAPKQMGDVRRMDFLWFLLHDEIHHRGQFSIYLRMSGAKVPSIYGPSGDEPWL